MARGGKKNAIDCFGSNRSTAVIMRFGAVEESWQLGHIVMRSDNTDRQMYIRAKRRVEERGLTVSQGLLRPETRIQVRLRSAAGSNMRRIKTRIFTPACWGDIVSKSQSGNKEIFYMSVCL